MAEITLKSISFGGDIEDTDGAREIFEILADGQKVVSATLQTWDDGNALIERIDIDDEEQGKGYGTAAIKDLARRADRCFIVPDNEGARRLYARLGSETTKDTWTYLDQGFGVYEL